MAERMRVETESLFEPDELVARVTALVARMPDGWAQYASGNVAWVGGVAYSTGDGARGLPLAGEWRTAEAGSVHLRQRRDGWVWTTITEGEGEGEIERTELLSNLPVRRASRLVYRTLWAPRDAGDGVHPLVPVFSRFAGWKE